MTRSLAVIITVVLAAWASSGWADSNPSESGRAHVKYHDFELTADVIDGGLDELHAQGGIVFTTSDRSFFGDGLDYILSTKSFNAVGGIKAVYQDYTLHADRITGSVETRELQASGSVRVEYHDPEQGDASLTADRVFGSLDSTMVAQGNAEIVGESGSIKADSITYRKEDGQFRAEGNPKALFIHEDESEVTLTAVVMLGNLGTDEIEASADVLLQAELASITGDKLAYNLKTRWFNASGGVKAVYQNTDREPVTLSAGTVAGNVGEGNVEAVGDVFLQTETRSLSGGRLTYNLSSEDFEAENDVRITERLDDESEVLLQASRVVGNWEEGAIEASGQVLFSQGEERSLSGDTFTYNFRTQKGIARNAAADIDNIYFRGEELTAEPDRYVISQSRFTTCDAEHPHFYLTARELIIDPDEKLTAKGMGFTLFGRKLLSLPGYSTGIGKNSGKPGIKLPTMGLSSERGAYSGYDFDLSFGSTTGNLDLQVSTREKIQGALAFEEIANQPIFLRAAHRQQTYSGLRSDLLVSRLPEVGFRFHSAGSANSALAYLGPSALFGGAINPFEVLESSSGIRLVGEAGVGRFVEEPNDVSSERIEGRLVAWIDPINLDDRTILTPGLSARLSHYGTGDDYTTLGLRLGIARKLGKDSYASVAYITNSVHGETPFEFDRLELREELAGRVRFPAAGLNLELGGRYDLRGQRFFDSEVTVSKVFHCIEPSITWRSRFKEISIGVGLVGF